MRLGLYCGIASEKGQLLMSSWHVQVHFVLVLPYIFHVLCEIWKIPADLGISWPTYCVFVRIWDLAKLLAKLLTRCPLTTKFQEIALQCFLHGGIFSTCVSNDVKARQRYPTQLYTSILSESILCHNTVGLQSVLGSNPTQGSSSSFLWAFLGVVDLFALPCLAFLHTSLPSCWDLQKSQKIF